MMNIARQKRVSAAFKRVYNALQVLKTHPHVTTLLVSGLLPYTGKGMLDIIVLVEPERYDRYAKMVNQKIRDYMACHCSAADPWTEYVCDRCNWYDPEDDTHEITASIPTRAAFATLEFDTAFSGWWQLATKGIAWRSIRLLPTNWKEREAEISEVWPGLNLQRTMHRAFTVVAWHEGEGIAQNLYWRQYMGGHDY